MSTVRNPPGAVGGNGPPVVHATYAWVASTATPNAKPGTIKLPTGCASCGSAASTTYEATTL
jgi:hypothetical protein